MTARQAALCGATSAVGDVIRECGSVGVPELIFAMRPVLSADRTQLALALLVRSGSVRVLGTVAVWNGDLARTGGAA